MNINEEINIEDAILETAERLFLEKGFALTSTTQIADAVGCNQAMVHYYYRTKDRLFEAVFEKKIKLFVSNLLHIGEENIPFKEKLRKRIETHFDMIKANPKLPFLIFNELTTNPKRLISLKEKIGQFPQSIISQLEKELQAEIKAGAIRPIETIDLVMTIISLNVILFLMSPVFKTVANISDDQFNAMIERRKKENVTIILNSLYQ